MTTSTIPMQEAADSLAEFCGFDNVRWQPEQGYAHGQLSRGPLNLHVYAIPVRHWSAGHSNIQAARYDEAAEMLEDLSTYDPGRYETVSAGEHDWVVFCTPFHD